MENHQSTNPKPHRRWFYPTPGRLLIILLAVEGFLLLSERFQWFAFNEKKGWTVLIAVAAVGLFLFIMLIWFIVSLIFRWHFQFSIRSLLALTVAIAIPSSWVAVKMQQAKRQKEVVDKCSQFLYVGYDYQLDAYGQRMPDAQVPGLAWLRKLLGDDFFSTVVEAEPNNDASMLILKDLCGIRTLLIEGPKVTDKGLAYLKEWPQLKELYLMHTTLTDTGWEHIKDVTQLQMLYFGYDATDAELIKIKELPQLQVLHLYGSDVTDAGLECLKGLTQLQVLNLSFNITDAGLEKLKGLIQLKELYLYGTNVTDGGLAHLKGLTQLQKLGLDRTKVTDEGVKKLQQALPHCSIQR
jgi:hypothetical protein